MQSLKIDRNELTKFCDKFPCGLLIFDINGSIKYANQTLANWLNTSEKSLLTRNFTDLLDKGGKFYFQLFVQPSLNMRQDVKEIDLTIKTPSSTFSCLFSASVIDDREEELISAAIYRINERKKYESELLNQKKQSDTEKEAKTNALQQIAFQQAHLVRAPLANMLGLISLLEQSDTSLEVKELLSLLHSSTLQLDTQIKSIVSSTNLNDGSSELLST